MFGTLNTSTKVAIVGSNDGAKSTGNGADSYANHLNQLGFVNVTLSLAIHIKNPNIPLSILLSYDPASWIPDPCVIVPLGFFFESRFCY